MKINSNAVKGFTLVEMMITLAIAAILITVALPSYNTFVKKSKITSVTNNIISSIALARGEAAKRGARVVLCRSSEIGNADPDCGGSTQNWSDGWLVYSVGDNRTTPLYDPSKDDVLIGQFSGEAAVTIKTVSANNQNLEFNPDGTTNENNETAYFAVCEASTWQAIS